MSRLSLIAAALTLVGADIGSPVPTVNVAVLGAEWCGPCRKLKTECEGMEGVGFLDIDEETDKARRLWSGAKPSAKGEGGLPTVLPAFVTIVDGEPVSYWTVRPDEKVDRGKIVWLLNNPEGES